MNYEKALTVLRGYLEGTPDFGEFLALEHRLLKVLGLERRHGETRDLDHERSRVVEGLNLLAYRWLKTTFNDLVFGRTSDLRLEPVKLALRSAELDAGPLPFEVPPPVETLLQELPIDRLTWKQFELLCVTLVESQPFVIDCHLYGVGGDKQLGIDIVATVSREEQTETWVYQCKQVKELLPRSLQKALDKVQYAASYLVVMLSTEASVKLRDVAAKRPNTFLWDRLDISRKLKLHPRLVEDFFGPVWKRAFCGSSGA